MNELTLEQLEGEVPGFRVKRGPGWPNEACHRIIQRSAKADAPGFVNASGKLNQT